MPAQHMDQPGVETVVTRFSRALWTAVAIVFLAAAASRGEPRVLVEWTFDQAGDAAAWERRNHVGDLRVEEGALQGRILDWDPWVVTPRFEITASPWQMVQVRLKTDCEGNGEIFWTNTTETKYGGFSPGKEKHFRIIGDGEWHEYQIMPFWQQEGKIIMLRLDFARPEKQDNGLKTFAVDWIRILEFQTPPPALESLSIDFAAGDHGWFPVEGASAQASDQGMQVTGGTARFGALRAPPMQLDVDAIGCWIGLEMAVDKGNKATLRWATETGKGVGTRMFNIVPDGRFHFYNVDMTASPGWGGNTVFLELIPSDAGGATATVKRLNLADAPQGPPVLKVKYAGLTDAINRAGGTFPFTLVLTNNGGEAATGLRITDFDLPRGVRVSRRLLWRRLPSVKPLEVVTTELRLKADAPVNGTFELEIRDRDGHPLEYRGEIRIDPSLDLPAADYVPEPRPVRSEYEIGALYFPGWPTIDRWARIWPTAPERKPVLGWYDEGNPECVDWQIKWAVENGIQFFLVDWYWNAGGRHLEHWIEAYKKARYRSYLKWAVMWANHNPDGSHSEEDQRNVTRFWLDHYFNMDEYYRINDMPVVMIWSPGNMERDVKEQGGVRRLLEISREMAKEAGYKGIWFIAMKWPEASTAPEHVQWLADGGFDMTSIYHFMDHGGKAENPRYFPFDLTADASYPFWRARRQTGILPFLPNLSTGWDSRPWHGDRARVIHGRSVPLFRSICEDAKRFADETGVKRLVLAPLNEWGEGSYAEPCKEFGFGMYESVRQTFCEEPADGWPLNYGPSDVGLGPYDLAMVKSLARTKWDFKNGNQNWSAMMGIRDFQADEGSLVFETAHRDPALGTPLTKLRASLYDALIVRMKLAESAVDPGALQLFWSTTSVPVSEATSVRVPLIADGRFHQYVLPLGESIRWRGWVTSFRLDTGSAQGLKVEIDRMRLRKAKR